MTQALLRECAAWADEARALLRSSVSLADYFGTRKEAKLLRRSVEAPLWWIDTTLAGATVPNGTPYERPDLTQAPAAVTFECSERLAAMLSPLFEVLVTPLPPFINTARRVLPREEHKRVTVPFGLFSGHMSRYVCERIWAKHKDLAPEGWPL